MNKEKKLSLRLGLLAGVLSLGVLGSTAGTLAWYAYSRTVTLSFVGTSVASSALLNVGIVDNDNYFDADDLVTFNLERTSATDGDETNSIVWSKSRTGFSLLALRHYLEKSPYAIDKLHPVTTKARAYDATSDLQLFRSPEVSETAFVDTAAQESYTVLPLAFRVINENSEYVGGKNVWLTNAACDAANGIQSSLRVFVDGASRFLMQPYDERNAVGETKVGGCLDLVGNGYYDTDTTGKEYCYGEFNTTPDHSTTAYSGADTLDNVNGVSDTSVATTFLAKHMQGSYVADIATAQPKVQTHAGVGKVKPSVNSNGQLYVDTVNGNGLPVATTSNGSKVAYATFTIFVEGWDHSVVDQKANYEFNLDLKFEIDRI